MSNLTAKPQGQALGGQMRMTDEDKRVIRALFKGNDSALRLMRKIFLPELDPNVAIGQMIDLWMTIKVDEMSAEDALINLKARNTLITHVDQMLMTLYLIANAEEADDNAVVAKAKKNSAQ